MEESVVTAGRRDLAMLVHFLSPRRIVHGLEANDKSYTIST
jgi:hypothetical protein